jgi:hypothetical protein
LPKSSWRRRPNIFAIGLKRAYLDGPHALTHLIDATDAKSWLFDDEIPACFPATASSVQQNAKPSLVHAEEFGAFAEGILADERLWFVWLLSRLVDTYSICDMGIVACYGVCLVHEEPPTLRVGRRRKTAFRLPKMALGWPFQTANTLSDFGVD